MCIYFRRCKLFPKKCISILTKNQENLKLQHFLFTSSLLFFYELVKLFLNIVILQVTSKLSLIPFYMKICFFVILISLHPILSTMINIASKAIFYLWRCSNKYTEITVTCNCNRSCGRITAIQNSSTVRTLNK